MLERTKETGVSSAMRQRARIIKASGGLESAIAQGNLDSIVDVTLSEAVVLGLLRQGVTKYFAIFGHGSTDLGEALRVYEEEGGQAQLRGEIAHPTLE